MALPLTHTTAELLDSLVLSTINTMTADTAWCVDDNGEKLVKKLANRGRVFNEVNDADQIEHALAVGAVPANSWKYYRGSREASGDQTMGSASSLALSQEGVFAPARSTIQDVASNFSIPQDLLKRPVQNALNVVEAAVKRHMKTFFREQEAYLTLGTSTAGSSLASLAPHLTDDAFNGYTNGPSFSLLGLMLEGAGGATASGQQYATEADDTRKFMGIATASGDVPEWAPYHDVTATKTSIASGGQTIYEYIQKYIIAVSRYGTGEMVTDWLVTPDMYEEVLKYMRSLSRNNDVLLNNLATTSEIPISGTMMDFHHFLAGDTEWDFGRTADTSYDTIHPILGLNLDSLRMNLVYGSANEDSWLTPLSDFQPAEDSTWFFKRLHSRFCFSLDNGRRSFVYSDRFKA